tara:strand:+ start:271 stop:459 length:189 start_codon:yes stop_codon:yes gene_type:complete
MAYKDHTMGKGKARVTTRNKKAHELLDKGGWGHPKAKKGMKYKHGGKVNCGCESCLRRPQHD